MAIAERFDTYQATEKKKSFKVWITATHGKWCLLDVCYMYVQWTMRRQTSNEQTNRKQPICRVRKRKWYRDDSPMISVAQTNMCKSTAWIRPLIVWQHRKVVSESIMQCHVRNITHKHTDRVNSSLVSVVMRIGISENVVERSKRRTNYCAITTSVSLQPDRNRSIIYFASNAQTHIHMCTHARTSITWYKSLQCIPYIPTNNEEKCEKQKQECK